VPILFPHCEDNGIGISVDTAGRVDRGELLEPHAARLLRAEGEYDEIWRSAREAIGALARHALAGLPAPRDPCASGPTPASDVETTYRTQEEIEAIEATDPLLRWARRLVETGAATPGDAARDRRRPGARVRAASEEAARRP
jgi:2-oxoisovalerate dehydrogenase E1 component